MVLKDKSEAWDKHTHTAMYKINRHQGPMNFQDRDFYQIFVTTYMREESKKGSLYVYAQLNHFAVYLKLTQHCKSITLQ